MKLITFRYGGESRVGLLREKIHVLDIQDMQALIERGLKEIETLITEEISPEEVELLAPIERPRQDVICLGMNYLDHEKESAAFDGRAFEKKKDNVYFSKRVNYAPGPGAVIPSHKEITQCLDYEAELALILGEDLRSCTPEEGVRAIFGYTILNDITGRDIQRRHMQFYAGKSLEGSCPMGPWIVTADELPGEPDLRIQTYVNGELRQDSRTSLFLSGIGEILQELSSYMTLSRGTIIATGTPAGVGMGFTPPKYLKTGDEVRCVIEGIGELVTIIGD